MTTDTTSPVHRPEKIEALKAQRDALMKDLQAMLDLPEDQRPKASKALKAWLSELDGTRRMLEQMDKLLQMLERKPKPRTRAVVAATPAPNASAEESDAVLLARIPKGARAELRVVVKTWKGRRVIDVRCWSLRDDGEFKPTLKGTTVDARMLPVLIEALQLATQYA